MRTMYKCYELSTSYDSGTSTLVWRHHTHTEMTHSNTKIDMVEEDKIMTSSTFFQRRILKPCRFNFNWRGTITL